MSTARKTLDRGTQYARAGGFVEPQLYIYIYMCAYVMYSIRSRYGRRVDNDVAVIETYWV